MTNHISRSDEHTLTGYPTRPDEAAAAILEQDNVSEFLGIGGDDDDEDSENSPPGPTGASSKDAVPPQPTEPESGNDDVQEVVPQHRDESTVSGLQLLGLHTATSTASRVIESKNPRQALTGPYSKEWHKAMDAEIKALESRDTWVLADRASIKGRRVLSGKKVFRVKTAADDTIGCLKACWVVRGYDQRHGIDFDQAFAPISRHTSVRPDLSYIASQLAEYYRKPTAENLVDLQRALQFFISMPNIGLCYSTVMTPYFNLIGYMGAGRTADPDNRRSRTGFLFRLEPTGPISRNLQQQELVALSSAEAEFIAATAVVRDGLYLQELLQEAIFFKVTNLLLAL
ncbi:unnamed protein product [Closterium sp. NIES-54]